MMNSLPIDVRRLPEYHVVTSDLHDEDLRLRLEAPKPIACEVCCVKGEFVRSGKRNIPCRDLPSHGKRVTLWVIRHRHSCWTCKAIRRHGVLPTCLKKFGAIRSGRSATGAKRS